MHPDYLDRERKTTIWAEIVAPPPAEDVSRASRRALEPEPSTRNGIGFSREFPERHGLSASARG
jgi:hypothetical protein